MDRIDFDTNAGSHNFGYFLDWGKPKEDLEKLGDRLREGLHVILHMRGELELEAVLTLDKETGKWLGMPVEGTIKYLDGSA